MHCNDLLSRLRACLAAALLAAALAWLTAAAFLPEESCLLPVLTAAAAAVTMAFWRRRVWLAPALWLGACAVTAAVFWRAAVSGVAALANGVLDAWKHLHAGNPELFAVAEERGAALLLCMLGALLGVWSASLTRRRSAGGFWCLTALLAALCLLFAPRLTAGWLLTAALAELLGYLLLFGGSDGMGAWLRAAALVLAFALALNGWQSAKPALLDRAVQWTRQQVQTLRYGSNAAAGLPEGDLRNVGPRRTTQETVLNITMQTPASYYLRGFTGEIYENNRWTALDAETLYPASDSFYWLHQDGFYAQAQIAAAADSVLPELLETKNSLTVENVGLSSRYLYAPYELLPDSAGLDASAVGDCTLAAQGFYGQRSYTLSAGTGLITQYQKINASLAQLPEDTQFLRDEAAYNAFAYQNYTAIPSDIRSYLAEKLGDYSVEEGETHFDYQNAKQNILFYLTSYIDYEETNLAPVGDGIDFVLNFLDGTQKGYDIHYATAAALMFRYYGIPARYVEGFLVTKQDAQVLSAGQTLSLTGAAAHAWVEYYQDGVGWLPFEVTPPYFSAMEQAERYQDISGLIGQQPHDRTVDNTEDQPQSDDTEDPTLLDFWLRHRLQILLALAILTAAALLVLFVLWLVWERKKTARRKAGFLSDDLPAAIRAIYDYTMDVLRAQGLRARNCPPEDYAAFLDEDLRARYRSATAIWQEASFSGHAMQEQQRQELLSLKDEIWSRTWKRSSLLRRIRLKYIRFL